MFCEERVIMRFRFPLITLWASLVYLLIATAVTGKQCFDQLRIFNQGAAKASGPLEFINPAWVIQETDVALDRLWWMCTAIGVGIVLLAASTVWVSVVGKGSIADQNAPPDRPRE
jgi:hypothetical protein